MTLIKAEYVNVYNDWNDDDNDTIPCLVDTEKMEVVEFYPAIRVKQEEALLMEEYIYFEDGREFMAMKFEEYEDSVDFGDAEPRDQVVLFSEDARGDALMAAYERD